MSCVRDAFLASSIAMRPIILALILILFSTPSRAQDAAAGGDSDARWLVRPGDEAVSLFFPYLALMQHVEGRAVVDCTTRLDQRMDCTLVSEGPAGWGFGRAAIGLARSFRMAPAVRGGVATPGSVSRVPVSFPVEEVGDAPPAFGVDLPAWESAPSATAVRAAWRQARDGVRGRGVLSCTVAPDRTLACRLVHESAPNMGFGEAAMALAPLFVVSERSTSFSARHQRDAFLLPINFGFAEDMTPLSLLATSVAPTIMPAPPDEVVAHVYPEAARTGHVSGSATVICTAGADSAFTCHADEETPTGWGFGAAAAALVQMPLAAMGDSELFLEGDQIRAAVPFRAPSSP
jgi:hypothetical protein